MLRWRQALTPDPIKRCNDKMNNSQLLVEQQVETNTFAEMAMQIRETQVGNIGLLAALSTLALFTYISWKTEDNNLQQLAWISFIFVEVFYLATLKFLLI